MGRFEVYLDPRWKEPLEKLLEVQHIKQEIIKAGFKEDASGVVKLLVSMFLPDEKRTYVPIRVTLEKAKMLEEILEICGYIDRDQFVNEVIASHLQACKKQQQNQTR